MTVKTERNGALDIYRYLTVTFAIISHIILHHGIYGDSVTGAMAIAKSVTRSATPTLIILFGMMIEMVYARRFGKDRAATAGALLYRALLCYAAFLILAFAAFVFDDANVARLLAAVPLISPAENGNIFKLYCILLLLTFPLLMLRAKFRVLGLVALVLVSWTLYYVVIDPRPALPYPLHHIGGVLLGLGDEWGPSILHSTLLVVFGMLMANVVVAERRMPFATAAFSVIVIGSVGFLLLAVSSLGIMEVANRIADIDAWRRTNHLGYYAFGITASVVILGISYALNWALPKIATAPIRAIGGVTLMYFFTANLMLSAVPEFVPAGILQTVGLVAGYVALFGVLAYAWATWGKNDRRVAAINTRGPELISGLFRRRSNVATDTLRQS